MNRVVETQCQQRDACGRSAPAGSRFTPLGFLPTIPIAGVLTSPAIVPVLAFIAEEPVVPALAEHLVPTLATDEPVLAGAPA
jgi:hypothetical protein